MSSAMRILLTNHHLMSYQGSEIFTFTIADFLKRKGHQVTVYSAYLGKLKKDFENIGVDTVTNLNEIKSQKFDIGHVHHQINAYEVRYHFPHLPIVLLCHGIVFLENPPAIDLNISQFLATSDRVRNTMSEHGVAKEKILLFRNMIDCKKFYSLSPINTQARNVLVVSNKIDPEKENVIREACKRLSLTTRFIGSRFEKTDYARMPELINKADIVFSLGRGAIETMLCERVPIVFDYEGGDGMVTPATIEENMTCNFSGNVHNNHYTVDELVHIIREYNPESAKQLRLIALEHFSADKQIDRLISMYHSLIDQQIAPLPPIDCKILQSIVSSISETRFYASQHTLPTIPLHRKWLRAAKKLYGSLINKD